VKLFIVIASLVTVDAKPILTRRILQVVKDVPHTMSHIVSPTTLFKQ
jgi:hypothetical protein